MISFTGPGGQPDFGNISVDMEYATATAFAQQIGQWQRFRVSDLGLFEKIKTQLK